MEAIVKSMVIENYPVNYGKSYYQIGGHPPDLHTFAKEGRALWSGKQGYTTPALAECTKLGKCILK